MGFPPVNAVFDTNIVIDALNGVPEADAEFGRYKHIYISRVTWMEVLVGPQDDDTQLRDFMETHFEIVGLDLAVAETARNHRCCTEFYSTRIEKCA
jgi:hypothetical protein